MKKKKKTIRNRVLPMALTAAMLFSSVPVMAAPNDLSGHWAEKVITQWQEKGLIKGYEDGTFKPNHKVTRAEFVIMMNNALGLSGTGSVAFSDVAEDAWYHAAVATAVEAGYCKGYEDGTFRPSSTITRAEAAVMIAGAADLAANAAGAAKFTDAAAIPGWALGSVGAVVEAGYMSGYPDGSFGATATITRAEAVSSLDRVMGNQNQAETPDVPAEEENTPATEEKTEEKKPSSGGGGGGGSKAPTPITKEADSAAALEAAMESCAANTKLTINIDEDAVLTDADVDATFKGKELIIDFNNKDMAENNLTITAPNATKIVLNDNGEGSEGTEVNVLTIDAPKADVESNVAAESVEIIAVKDGTFHAKDKHNEIKIKKGAVEVDKKVAETTKVTVPEDATGEVKVKGKVNEVSIETKQKVALEAEVEQATVKAEKADVTVSENAVITTVNIEESAAGTKVTGKGSIETANVSAAVEIDTKDVKTLEVQKPVAVTIGAVVETVKVILDVLSDIKAEISGTGSIEKIEASNDVIVSANNVTEVEVGDNVTVVVKEDVANITVPENTTGAKIEIAENTTVNNVTTSSNVTVAGSGTITKIDAETKENASEIKVSVDENADVKVDTVVNTGSGSVQIDENIKNAEGEAVTAKTVESIRLDVTEAKTAYKAGEKVDLTGVKIIATYSDGSEASFDAKGNAAVTVSHTAVSTKKEAETITVTYAGYEATYDVTVELTEKLVKETLDVAELDLSVSDEWRTDGYIYDYIPLTFEGAEWAEPDYDNFVFRIDGKEFRWGEDDKPGDYALEVDTEEGYDEETGIGDAVALIAAYVDNVKPGNSFKVEIEVPAYCVNPNKGYQLPDDERFIFDFTVNIKDSDVVLPAAKDTLEAITLDLGVADDWRTEGYVYTVADIDFKGADWRAEPYWAEHITYYINEKQFVWDWKTDKPGEYPLEVEMVPVYDEVTGDLHMQAMVFAYVDEVKNGDTFDVEINIPTYCLERTDEAYRITRNETAVIDFTVTIANCQNYVPPVADTVENMIIDLSTADDWRTEGYVYQMVDMTFNAAEFVVTKDDFDWNAVTYWVNGEQFIWNWETCKPGDFNVELDLMDYYYDAEEGVGHAEILVCVYTDNVNPDEGYALEIQFPSEYLRVTDEQYQMKCGDTFTTYFNVYITDSESELESAKDRLDEINIDLATADKWERTEGYVYTVEDITFDGAKWIREPYWDAAEHVTYWIDGEQFIWDETSKPGDFTLEVDMAPAYDEETGELSMEAMLFVYVDNVKDQKDFDVEIKVPTYCLERTEDDYRITREETAVIDFTVHITDSASAEEVNFTLQGSDNHFYLTWDDMGYESYVIYLDNEEDDFPVMWMMDGSTTSMNLLHFVPCAEEDTVYDIVLKDFDSDAELVRLEDALSVKVFGSAAEYEAVFSETGVDVTWTPTPGGIAHVYELKQDTGFTSARGGGSITATQRINHNLTGGESLDMRVITDAALTEQVLYATITPESKETYEVEEKSAVTWNAENFTMDTSVTTGDEFTITVTLANDAFKDEIAEDTDITEWFRGMPTGWTAIVEKTVDADDKKIFVTIIVVEPETGDGEISMEIPAEYLKNSEDALCTSEFHYEIK